jgi:DnaJ-domain-containing protein 1
MSERRRHAADRELGITAAEQAGCRLCEWPDCGRAGDFRAPRSREQLRSFRYFCLDHVREYNRAWDFFQGMTQAEIEAYLREDVTWHRPTWRLGTGPQQHGRNWRWQDPFEVLFSGPDTDGRASASEWDRPKARLGTTERMLAVMNLGPEATLQEIKARYKELVKLHHPDLHGGDKQSEERLKLINEAYTYLRGSDRYA